MIEVLITVDTELFSSHDGITAEAPFLQLLCPTHPTPSPLASEEF